MRHRDGRMLPGQLNAQRGASMLSALISLGVILMGIATFTSIFRNKLAARRLADQATRRPTLIQDMSNALAFKDVCLGSFGDFDVSDKALTKAYASIRNAANGTSLYAVGAPLADGLLTIKSMTLGPPKANSPAGGTVMLSLAIGRVGSAQIKDLSGSAKGYSIPLYYSVDPAAPKVMTGCGSQVDVGSTIGSSKCYTVHSSFGIKDRPCGYSARALCNPGDVAIQGGTFKAMNAALGDSTPILDPATNVPTGWQVFYIEPQGSGNVGCDIDWVYKTGYKVNYTTNICYQFPTVPVAWICGGAMAVCCSD